MLGHIFNPLKKIADFHHVGSIGLIKCQYIGVGLDLFLPFLMDILLMFITPCFPSAAAISSAVVKANFLLLITPLDMVSFSCVCVCVCVYALYLVVWKIFIFRIISACLRLSPSTSELAFFVFLTFWEVALVTIIFSIR